MADVQHLLLCAPLCFAVKRINTLETEMLFSALYGHYSDEEITVAKKQLKADIDSLKLTRHTDRYDVETRKKNEVNDIIKMLKFVDQQMSLSRLPKYVADDPDTMPYFRIMDGDFKHIIRRMNTMEDMLKGVYSLLRSGPNSAYANKTTNIQSTSLHGTYAGLLNQPDQRDQVFALSDFPALNENPTVTVDHASSLFRQAIHHAAANSQVVKQPVVTRMTGKPTSSSSQAAASAVRASRRNDSTSNHNTENDTDTDNDGKYRLDAWQRRKEAKKRRRVKSPPEDYSEEQLTSKPTTRRQSKPLLVGRKTDESDKVIAAKSLQRKYVYYVDNLNESVTAEDLTTFVSSLGVQVFNCFAIRPRRTAQQKRDNVVDNERHAFRLCINRADKVKMMKPDMWPADVLIKRWYWRKDGDHSDDDVQARDDGATVQAHQQTTNATDLDDITDVEHNKTTDEHGGDGN